MTDTKINYAFWYREKQVLFVPEVCCAYEFIQEGLFWTVIGHYADSEAYWLLSWDADNGWTREKPDPEASVGNMCFEAKRHGNLCPYLDEPCVAVPDHPERITSFLEPTEAMYLWLAYRRERKPLLCNWEVIEKP